MRIEIYMHRSTFLFLIRNSNFAKSLGENEMQVEPPTPNICFSAIVGANLVFACL